MKQLSLKRKNLKKNIQLNDCITVLRRLIEGLSVSEGPYFIAIKNSTFHRHKNALKLAVFIVGNEFGLQLPFGKHNTAKTDGQPFMAGICAANMLTVVSQALPLF